ncbi:MAG: Cytosol aminopeptidase [Holosporales bacterium]
MKINFIEQIEPSAQNGTLVLGIAENGHLLSATKEVDTVSNGQLTKALAKANFKGNKNETLKILAPTNVPYEQILLIGCGDLQKLTCQTLKEIGATIRASISNEKKFVIDMLDLQKGQSISNAEAVANIAMGFELRNFKFDKYKTKKDPQNPEINTENVFFITADPKSTKAYYDTLKAICEGVCLTRTVVSEPPNVLYPETMAEHAKELTKLGVTVEVFTKSDLERMNMGGILGVAQGSVKEPRLIVLQWLHGDKKQAPVALVGKGVTFDSGGISIKPSANMEDMKYDMAGSGAVLGTFKALALRKAKVNVVGVMAMVENMPSGSALKPADILKTMSGQTIEVQNTDAEGRLILADALWYAQDRFKPQAMIDLATLTGAITVALGSEFAGLFSNNHELVAKLLKAGDDVDEGLWRLPMNREYDKLIDSDIADVKNISMGIGGGSITAAQFLQRFVNNTPWAHLDIAGTAWSKKGKILTGKGATAFGVRLLNQYLMDTFES